MNAVKLEIVTNDKNMSAAATQTSAAVLADTPAAQEFVNTVTQPAGWLMQGISSGHGDALAWLHSQDADGVRPEWLKVLMTAAAKGLAKQQAQVWSKGSPKHKQNDFDAAWLGALKKLGKPHDPAGTQPVAQKHEQQDERIKLEKLFNAWPDAPADHAYLSKKRILPNGLKLVIGTTNIAVPLCELDGRFCTVQYLPAEGGKKFHAGLSTGAGMFIIGKIAPADTVYIAEGLATGWSIYNTAPSAAVAIAFGIGRFQTVAPALHDMYPNAKIVLCPDRGQEATGEKVAATLGLQWLALPAERPDKSDWNDLEAELFGQMTPFEAKGKLAALLATVKTPSAPPPEAGAFKFFAGDDYVVDFIGPPELVRGLLPSRGIGMIFGESGSGKTFWALDVACHVHNGAAWCGQKVMQGDVFYCAAEAGRGVKKRLAAIKVQHPQWCMPYVADQAPNLRSPDDIKNITKAIQSLSIKPALVMVDTLSASFDGNDSDQKDAAVAMRHLKAMADALQCTVVFVHHKTKNKESWRGSGVWFNDVDVVVEISADGPEGSRLHTAKVIKNRDDETKEPWLFQLRKTDPLATRPDGSEITSCVVQHLDAESTPAKPVKVMGETLTKAELIYRELHLDEGPNITMGRLWQVIKQKKLGLKKYNIQRDYAEYFGRTFPKDGDVVWL